LAHSSKLCCLTETKAAKNRPMVVPPTSSTRSVLSRRFSVRRRVLATAAGIAGIAVVGVMDWQETEIAFSVYYLLPVGLAAWMGGRIPGLIAGAVAAAVWYFVEQAQGFPYSSPLFAYGNAMLRMACFSLIIYFATRIRFSTSVLRALV